jgi:hypothetical protein
MSGASRHLRMDSVYARGSKWARRVGVLLLLACCALLPAAAQQRREREPNSVYAERRAKLPSHIDGPIVLLGLTGREQDAQTYVFAQDENFYYLTGHNEPGAAVLLLPPAGSSAKKDDWEGPREIFFLPPKNPGREKWLGLLMSPSYPGIEARTGFAQVKPYPELRATAERLAKFYPSFYTVLPYEHENGSYPHERETVDWLKLAVPQANIKDIRTNITDLRAIKSPTEIALLRQAIDLSLDAHFAKRRREERRRDKPVRKGLLNVRIEPEEIEAILGQHPGLDLVQQGRPGACPGQDGTHDDDFHGAGRIGQRVGAAVVQGAAVHGQCRVHVRHRPTAEI